MGSPYLWEGTPLLDSGTPAIHADCCCGGCGACFYCIDGNSPHEVSVTFTDVGDVTPRGCDEDDDGVNSDGECHTEFKDIAYVLECDSESAGDCGYGYPSPSSICAGSGTNGAITGISFGWQTDLRAVSGKLSPTLTIGQSTDNSGSVVNYIQYNGDPTYPIDCTAAWSMTFHRVSSSGTGNYPCAFGSATAIVTPVF